VFSDSIEISECFQQQQLIKRKKPINEGISLDIYRRRIGSFHSTPVRGNYVCPDGKL
jgi:hypothetical protein